VRFYVSAYTKKSIFGGLKSVKISCMIGSCLSKETSF